MVLWRRWVWGKTRRRRRGWRSRTVRRVSAGRSVGSEAS